jgi:hypothetical protein
MKKTMIVTAMLVLAGPAFAGVNATPASATTQVKTVQHKAKLVAEAKPNPGKMLHQFKLTGITKENMASIEKIAKEAGAERVHVNQATGAVKVWSKNEFDKTKFTSALEQQLPQVKLNN